MAANVALLESSQKCNHLNSFAQPHLVSDNPPSLLAVKFPEPLHTSLLVSERGGGEGGGGSEVRVEEKGEKRSEREGGRDWEGGWERRESRDGERTEGRKERAIGWRFCPTNLYSLCQILPGTLNPPSNTASGSPDSSSSSSCCL